MPDDKKKYGVDDWMQMQQALQPQVIDTTNPAFMSPMSDKDELSFWDKIKIGIQTIPLPENMGMGYARNVATDVVSGLQGAYEKEQESNRLLSEGDYLGSTTSKMLSPIRSAFSLAQLHPLIGSIVQGTKELQKQIPETKYITNPVSELTKPESVTGQNLAEIGDALFQVLLGKGVAKGIKTLKPTVPKETLKMGDATELPKVDIVKEQVELQKMLEKEVPQKKMEKLVEGREPGVRVEKDIDYLKEKYPTTKPEDILDTRVGKEYKEFRDDGTQTFDNAFKEAKLYKGITEESLLRLDPRTLRDETGRPYVFNKAQQIKIDAIALKKVQDTVNKRKSWGEQLSSEQLLELDKDFMESMKLQALAKNNVREAARIMEVNKRKHSLTQEEVDVLNEVAKELGKTKDVSFKAINDILEPKFRDKALFWWYNSVLSNPFTDISNVLGNATMLGWEVATQPNVLINGSLLKGIKEGYKNASNVWKGETKATSKYTEGRLQAHADILKTKGKVTTRVKNTLLPTSRLAIEDSFFRSIFENIREKQVSKELSKKYQTTEKIVTEQLEKIIKGEESNLIDPKQLAEFEKQVNAIESYANEMVFQKPLGELGRKIQSALNTKAGLPIKLLAMPFFRIAVNLTKASLKNSPIGFTKMFGKNWGELTKLEQSDIIRRATAGSVFYASVLKMMDDKDFEIIGDLGTIPKSRRELLEANGYRENSVVITNKDGSKTAIPFQNISPINIVLGGIGTLYAQSQWGAEDTKQRDATELITKGILSTANALGNQSFLQGTSQLISAFERNDPTNINNTLVRLATPNILSLTGSADLEFLGMKPRKIYVVEGLMDAIRNRLGVTNEVWGEEAMQPKSDVFGEDRVSRYRRFPVPTTEQSNKVAQLLLDSGVGIGDFENEIIDGKRKFTERKITEINKDYRQNLYKLMNENYDSLKKIWDETKDSKYPFLEKMVDRFKRYAKIMLIEKHGNIILGEPK